MTDPIQASQPIDTGLFVRGETTHFMFEGVVKAPVEAVYRAWIEGDAFKAAYGPEREELRADIDPHHWRSLRVAVGWRHR